MNLFHKSLFVLIFSIIFLSNPVYSSQEKNLEQYLHKNAILAVPPLSFPPPHETDKRITPRKACYYAIKHLKEKGIKNIVICEVQWIAAATSGYLIDLKGNFTINNEDYNIFRIGITDGYKSKFKHRSAGEEFVFMALRKTKQGKIYWYPKPGPDYKLKKFEAMPESSFVYEYLLNKKNRKRLETLDERYK